MSSGGLNLSVSTPNGTKTSTGTTFLRKVAGYYGMLGYWLGDFLPRYTYAYVDSALGFAGADGKGTSHNFGLNYRIAPTVILKNEFVIDKSMGAKGLSQIGVGKTISTGVDLIF